MNNLKNSTFYKVLIFGTFITFFSCSKATESTPSTISITGTWVGTQSEPNATISTPISFVIKSDNTFDFFSDGRLNSGSGTWQLTDNVFTASYVFRVDSNSMYIYTANYDPKTGKLSPGTWYIRGNTNRGTWTMLRQ